MKNKLKYPVLGLSFILMSFAWLVQPRVKVYMIGDSTMCIYGKGQFPITGWGMPFANYFDASVTIDNRAKGGRSTRTFLSENRWQPVADSLRPGDYVIIQFGHNDEGPLSRFPDRYTSVPDYKTNLIKFVTETQAKKANPILVTPVSRSLYDKTGELIDTHFEYSKAVFEVGTQYHVPVIDLNKKSRELFKSLGPANTKILFMQLDSAEHPNYPLGRKDATHFNEYGARKIAEIVLNQLKEQHIPLADHIVIGTNKSNVPAQAK